MKGIDLGREDNPVYRMQVAVLQGARLGSPVLIGEQDGWKGDLDS